MSGQSIIVFWGIKRQWCHLEDSFMWQINNLNRKNIQKMPLPCEYYIVQHLIRFVHAILRRISFSVVYTYILMQFTSTTVFQQCLLLKVASNTRSWVKNKTTENYNELYNCPNFYALPLSFFATYVEQIVFFFLEFK